MAYLKFYCFIFVFPLIRHARTTDNKIVAGVLAKDGRYLFAVSLTRESRKTFCGGTLLNIRNVLTACHCLGNVNTKGEMQKHNWKSLALAGNINIKSDKVQVRETSHSYYHSLCKSASKGYIYDYGVFVVKKPFEMTANLTTISLYSLNHAILKAKTDELVEKGTTCTAIGWGTQTRSSEEFNPSDYLKKIDVNLISWHECNLSLCTFEPNCNLNFESQICAEADKGDVCGGDSGGPLICSGYIYAIVSWGVSCGNFPTVYARIDEGLDFIKTYLVSTSTVQKVSQHLYGLLLLISLLNIFLCS